MKASWLDVVCHALVGIFLCGDGEGGEGATYKATSGERRGNQASVSVEGAREPDETTSRAESEDQGNQWEGNLRSRYLNVALAPFTPILTPARLYSCSRISASLHLCLCLHVCSLPPLQILPMPFQTLHTCSWPRPNLCPSPAPASASACTAFAPSSHHLPTCQFLFSRLSRPIRAFST